MAAKITEWDRAFAKARAGEKDATLGLMYFCADVREYERERVLALIEPLATDWEMSDYGLYAGDRERGKEDGFEECAGDLRRLVAELRSGK